MLKLDRLKRNLLIIDDDKTLCKSIFDYYNNTTIDAVIAHRGEDGIALCSENRIDIVLLDQKLPDIQGHKLCSNILKFNEHTKIIFSTAYPTFDNALKAIKAGAFDYLSKPFELEELDIVIKKALRTLKLEKFEQLQIYKDLKNNENCHIVGSSDSFLEIKELLKVAANTKSPVLITGETGTGKSLVAKYIHYSANKNNEPFVSVNCAAIPENLIESELFGHEKGAFTGAIDTKKGVFEMADGGTIFLDEIGEIPFHLQSKLLSVLEENVVRRVGSNSNKRISIRIIAATNADLSKAITKKKFREDLFYRLSVLRIHIPPLRLRKEDITELSYYLLKMIASKENIKIPSDELLRLKEYDWPGNVRELRNILERAVMLRKRNLISPSKFLENNLHKPISRNHDIDQRNIIPTLNEIETNHIKTALKQFNGNYTRTARVLGISLSTLKRKVKYFN